MTNRTRIVCFGAGFVGGPTMAMLADFCPDIDIFVYDINPKLIEAWANGQQPPLFEPDLQPLVARNRNRNLFFVHEVETYLAEAAIIFIAVQTPLRQTDSNGGCTTDLRCVDRCLDAILSHAGPGHRIVVEKSTVPVGCSAAIRHRLSSEPTAAWAAAEDSQHGTQPAYQPSARTFSVLNNPEFLAEGQAVANLRHPDRVLLGHEPQDPFGLQAAATLGALYRRWVPEDRILHMTYWSSELAKLASNAMLAQRLTAIQALSCLCEATGASISEVGAVVGADSRIGPHFLQASMGYGGSCLSKDVRTLVYLARSLHLEVVAAYWEGILRMNTYQMQHFARRIVSFLSVKQKGSDPNHHKLSLEGRRIAILGFAFKKETSDCRGTSATAICMNLLEAGAVLRVYDPHVTVEGMQLEWARYRDEQHHQQAFQEIRCPDLSLSALHASLSRHATLQEAAKHTTALVLLTDWQEFLEADYERDILPFMEGTEPRYFFDGRHVMDPEALRQAGFHYVVTVGEQHAAEVQEVEK